MIGFVSISVLCLSSFVFVDGQHDNHQDHKVNVTVYYESLCPDSIKFVTTQVYPALQIPELNKHINLTLVPFGKSKIDRTSTGVQFNCHHGERECTGNKIHACALNKITTNDPQSKVTVNFINCLLKKVDTIGKQSDFPVQTCSTSENVQNMVDIENCATASEGVRLLEHYGNITNAFQEPLKSVPTVVFDDKYNEAENQKAQTNFVGILCDHIHHDKPNECTKSAAVQLSTSFVISLLTLLATFKVF